MRRISFLVASAPFLVLAALLPLASCDNATGPRLGAYALTGVSGDGQVRPVGEPLAAPMWVRLLAGERPMANVRINWSADGGLLDGETSRTDAKGEASMGWTMATKPGTYHATAAMATAGTIHFTVTVTVGSFSRLRLSPDSLSLTDVGDTAALAVATTDRFGNAVDKPPVTWTSLAPTVASVSEGGVVRGVNGGTGRIVATSLGIADTVTVTVAQQVASVALVTRTAEIRSLRATTTLRANVLDRLGNPVPGATASWSTLDPLIVAVDGKGVVTGVAAGTGRVRVAAGHGADTALVRVVQVPKRVVMLPTTANLPAGDNMLIQPTAYDSLGSIVPNPSILWYSSDSTIVQLVGGGWVHGLRAGTVRVYANARWGDDITAVGTTTITVGAGPIVQVRIQPDATTLRVGESSTLTVVATDALGNVATNPAVTWSSSDTSRVTVNSSGQVTGVRLGSATISATVAGVTGTAQVNVASALPGSVRVARDRDTLNYLGATRQLAASVYDGFGAQIPSLTPTWLSLDPTLLTVTTAGVATELAGGGAFARAVASYSGFADTVTLVLRQVPRTIGVTPTTLSLAVGDSAAVTLTVGPDSGGAAVTTTAASESNTVVARVRWTGSVPYVVAVGAGSAIIQFYAGGAIAPVATVDVTVSAPGPDLVPVQPAPGVLVPAGSASRSGGGAGS